MADRYCDPAATGSGTGTSWTDAYTTFQALLDACTAGDTGYCRGTDTIAATVDDDTNSGSNASWITIVGCNASGVEDGTQFIVDAANSRTSVLSLNGRTKKTYRNITFKRATSDGVLTVGTNTQIRFKNCKFESNGRHGFNCATVLNYARFMSCWFTGNTTNAVAGANQYYNAFSNCVISSNGNGIQTSFGIVERSIIKANTGYGISSASNLVFISENTIDGNGTGISVAGHAGINVMRNRITNNTTGISLSSATGSQMFSDYNSFYGNGTKTSIGANGSYIDGGNNIDEGADPYINRAAGNFAPKSTAGIVGTALATPDALTTDYLTAGFGIKPPTIPAVGVVLVNAEGGPIAYGYYDALTPTFSENTRNTALDAAKLEDGYAVQNRGATVTGTLVGEAHTANQILKSAGGNYDDDELVNANVKKNVEFGIGGVGTYDPSSGQTTIDSEVLQFRAPIYRTVQRSAPIVRVLQEDAPIVRTISKISKFR